MVSAAAHVAAVNLRRSDYDKRIQDNILSLLLRRINEAKDKSPLLLKYQRFRELLTEKKTTEIDQFINKFNKELSTLKDFAKDLPHSKPVSNNRKNDFVNSPNFKKLFPQADVLFEFSEYGVTARELLRENVSGNKKTNMEFLPTIPYFKKQSCFNGILVEQYSDSSFDGLKGLNLDFYH